MSQYIYSQRYGLKDQACVQVLVPEHEKQCESVQVADPEIVFAVSSCQKHASQPQYRRYQVYQQDRSVTSDGEKRIVYYLLHHFQLTFGQIFLLRCSTTIKCYPTDPSSETCRSFWASTANSIGSFDSTSRAYPLTIRPTASSGPIPLWLQ